MKTLRNWLILALSLAALLSSFLVWFLKTRQLQEAEKLAVGGASDLASWQRPGYYANLTLRSGMWLNQRQLLVYLKKQGITAHQTLPPQADSGVSFRVRDAQVQVTFRAERVYILEQNARRVSEVILPLPQTAFSLTVLPDKEPERWLAIRDPRQVPAHSLIEQMVVLNEDPRYPTRASGVDYAATGKAAIRWLLNGDGEKARGASTICQQLFRAIPPAYMARNTNRKLDEILWCDLLYRTNSQAAILQEYLSVLPRIMLNNHLPIIGVRASARFCFNKEIEALSPKEAAFIAALLPRQTLIEKAFPWRWEKGAWREKDRATFETEMALVEKLVNVRLEVFAQSQEFSASKRAELKRTPLQFDFPRPGEKNSRTEPRPEWRWLVQKAMHTEAPHLLYSNIQPEQAGTIRWETSQEVLLDDALREIVLAAYPELQRSLANDDRDDAAHMSVVLLDNQSGAILALVDPSLIGLTQLNFPVSLVKSLLLARLETNDLNYWQHHLGASTTECGQRLEYLLTREGACLALEKIFPRIKIARDDARIHSGVGKGLEISLLEMAEAYSAIARQDGQRVRATSVMTVTTSQQVLYNAAAVREPLFSASAAGFTYEAMQGSLRDGGTLFRAFQGVTSNLRAALAGKTGSSSSCLWTVVAHPRFTLALRVSRENRRPFAGFWREEDGRIKSSQTSGDILGPIAAQMVNQIGKLHPEWFGLETSGQQPK